MKAESDRMPVAFEINRNVNFHGDCEVLFYENAVEKEVDEAEMPKKYEFDFYRVIVPFSNGLQSDIEENYDWWIGRAKEIEAENEYSVPFPTEQDLLNEKIALRLAEHEDTIQKLLLDVAELKAKGSDA